MRNILLALVLANILYFMWGRYVADDGEYGVAVLEESQLGPPLEIAETAQGEATAEFAPDDAISEPTEGEESEAEADATEEPITVARRTEFSASVGRSCVTVGPFTVGSEAESAREAFEADGMRASQRNAEAPVFVGHWVQIRNVANRSEGNAMIEKLKDGGLGDAYLVETDDEGLKISLGLFGEMARAERIELQAKSLDLPADISPRTRDTQVIFVDVALPPGRGAGNIVNEYGEERVLLRGAATCPK